MNSYRRHGFIICVSSEFPVRRHHRWRQTHICPFFVCVPTERPPSYPIQRNVTHKMWNGKRKTKTDTQKERSSTAEKILHVYIYTYTDNMVDGLFVVDTTIQSCHTNSKHRWSIRRHMNAMQRILCDMFQSVRHERMFVFTHIVISSYKYLRTAPVYGNTMVRTAAVNTVRVYTRARMLNGAISYAATHHSHSDIDSDENADKRQIRQIVDDFIVYYSIRTLCQQTSTQTASQHSCYTQHISYCVCRHVSMCRITSRRTYSVHMYALLFLCKCAEALGCISRHTQHSHVFTIYLQREQTKHYNIYLIYLCTNLPHISVYIYIYFSWRVFYFRYHTNASAVCVFCAMRVFSQFHIVFVFAFFPLNVCSRCEETMLFIRYFDCFHFTPWCLFGFAFTIRAHKFASPLHLSLSLLVGRSIKWHLCVFV